MQITSEAKTAREFRDEIVANLRYREQMFRDSISRQTTKATKACCYTCAEAMKTAAADFEACVLAS